jgi:CHAT domain-containing protein
MLKDRVLATLLTAEGTRHLSLPNGRSSLGNLVQRLKASVELESEPLVATALSELHQALVAPLASALGATSRLVIVPDRELWDVPFAGLTPVRGGAPLASRYDIAFATSLVELMRSREAWTRPRSILAVGDPSWDKALFADLPRLTESLNEVRGVAALYERSRVLSGTEATRAAVQRLAPGFDVVHVATHAVGNDRDPGESFVLLSADRSDPGMWRASDPGWGSLSKARLVVLSACRTGSQRSRFGGASLGVLRSIQLATTAEVLASTGDVDDAASRRLLEGFHRNLLAGDTPAGALRLAQMDARAERSGMTWMLYRIVM